MVSTISQYRYYLFVFFSCLAVSFFSGTSRPSPVYYPDSYQYLQVAVHISRGLWPDFSYRVPAYPHFLAPLVALGHLDWAITISRVFAAVAAVCLLWLTNRLFRFHLLNALAVILAYSDYAVIAFHPTLLVESLAPALLCCVLAFNIWLALARIPTWPLLALVLVADLPLMYLKPNFLILPLLLKAYLLVSALLFPRFISRRSVTRLLVGITVNLAFLLALPTYNYFRTGSFQISRVGAINSFGRALSLGYLEPLPYYQDAPEVVQSLIKFNLDHNRFNSPYDFQHQLQKEGVTADAVSLFAAANPYLYFKNKRPLALALPRLVAGTFTTPRQFYSRPQSPPPWDPVHTFLNQGKFVGFILSLVVYVYWLVRRRPAAVVLGAILLSVFYIVVSVTVFSDSEFARLRVPADVLLNLLTLFPLISLLMLLTLLFIRYI